ncbi:MAG: PBP1A family penicillin-binding protein, partial [Candidatus Sericytochromatia bacterium]|nr:PBP1A family penicillin-binding protein [Candidatus Sericytochromatia bacterium]
VGGLRYYTPAETTEILDRKGRLVAKVHDEENRSADPLAQISPWLQKAVIAAEDDRFWTHHGIDLRGLVRGATVDVSRRGHATGGSTLTQQLAKNLFLTPERTPTRKLAEFYLSLQIEQRYSKHEILQLYLNQVYWGHNAYGCEAAAQTYFGKHASQLNLAEAAMIAGLIPGPELFSPYHSLERAQQRQALVLNRMTELGVITPAQAEGARAMPVQISGLRQVYNAPYFTSYVLSVLNERYGPARVRQGGLKVTTTVDMDWQLHAEKLIHDEIAKLKDNHVSQGALACVDNETGGIRALVGGVGYSKSQFNRATQAMRPPGSSFKPFVYLTGFAHGLKPESIEVDEPMSYKMGDGTRWKPHNYDNRFRGSLTIRRALETSINIVAIKILDMVTPKKVIETAMKFGFHDGLNPNLSLALGTSEVTPLELASAYEGLANMGRWTAANPIIRVETRQGEILEENNRPEFKQVFPAYFVATLVDCMQGVLLRGTGAGAYFGRPAAGKTGTSSDHRDAWFAGFTPQLTAVVWAGNDDNSQMIGITGGDVCAPIWKTFMEKIHKGLPEKKFPDPEKVAGASDAKAAAKVLRAKTKIVEHTWEPDSSPRRTGPTEPQHEDAPAKAPRRPSSEATTDAPPAGWQFEESKARPGAAQPGGTTPPHDEWRELKPIAPIPARPHPVEEPARPAKPAAVKPVEHQADPNPAPADVPL